MAEFGAVWEVLAGIGSEEISATYCILKILIYKKEDEVQRKLGIAPQRF